MEPLRMVFSAFKFFLQFFLKPPSTDGFVMT